MINLDISKFWDHKTFFTHASILGVLAIGVPGELKGYQLAHEKFGSKPWAALFQPAIDMAKNGFKVLYYCQ